MKAIFTCILLLISPFSSMLAVPPAGGAAKVRPVKGLIVVYDGSTLLHYSTAYEYSELLQDRTAFKATLPNGQSVTGMSSQLIENVDYQNHDVKKMLVEAERIAASYAKAKPILAIRIPQLRERSLLKGDAREGAGKDVASLDKNPEGGNPKSAESARPDASTNTKPGHNPLTGKSPTEIFLSANGDHNSRLNAIMQIAMGPKEDDFHALARAAQDKDGEIQKWGIRGLGKLKSKPALEKLIEVFGTRELTATQRKQIIGSIGSFTSNMNQDLSLQAVDRLCEIAEEASYGDIIKSEAIQQITLCLSEGKGHIRARVEAKDSMTVRSVVSQIKNHEASVLKAAEELKKAAEAFTIRDRMLLKGYATGAYTSFLSDGTAIPGQTSNTDRLSKCKSEIYEVTEWARYDPVFRLNGGYQDAQQTLRREQARLESGDPLQIAIAALNQFVHLRGVCRRTQNDRTRKKELFTDYNVTYGNGLTQTESRLTLGAIFNPGGGHTAMYLDSVREFNKIRSMLLALSSTAQKQLGIRLNGVIGLEVKDTIQRFEMKTGVIALTSAWVRFDWAGGVDVYLSFARDKGSDRIYDGLMADKPLIENEIGVPLVWKRDDEQQSIVASRPFGDLLVAKNHAEAQKWLDDVKSRYVNTFCPRIQSLLPNE